MKKHLFIFFTIFSLAFLSFAGLSHAVLAGKVSISQGRVDVLKPGQNMAVPVKTGDAVDVGDIYRTKSDGKAEITFINGNILKIASNTRAEIKEALFEGDKNSNIIKLHRGRVQAISGEDFIKKVSAFAEGNRFEVHTPNAVAGIRGSNMIVSFLQRITSTLFIRGKGYQYNPNDLKKKIVSIMAGYISFVTSQTGSPTMSRTASEAEIAIYVNAMAMLNPGDDTTGASLDEGRGTNAAFFGFSPFSLPPMPPFENTETAQQTQPQVTNYTGSFGDWRFYDDNFSASGNIAATMNGSIPDGTNTGSAGFSGTYENPDRRQIWSGGFEGSVDQKGAFLGYAGGSWTSWSGNAIGLLAESGNIGFLATRPSGNSADDGTFSGSGNLEKMLAFPTTLAPAEGQTWLDALKNNVTTNTYNSVDSGQWSIIDTEGRGTATFSASKRNAITTSIRPEFAEGNNLGVIREMLSGSSYNNPTHATLSGMYGERLGDSFYSIGGATLTDNAAHNTLTMNVENTYMTTRFIGSQTIYYEGTYDALNGPYRMVGVGTMEGYPLSHVSKVSQGRFQGLLGSTQSLWTEDPVVATFIGKLANVGPTLEIHACDNGWHGGAWTTLLPGGVQKVDDYQYYNYVIDASHPIAQGVVSPIIGNYASHNYFTNLLNGTKIIFAVDNNSLSRPTTIEYLYNGGRVLTSAQTLEHSYTYGFNTAILPNMMSYVTSTTSMPGKTLLIQDVLPWASNANTQILDNLGVTYDVIASANFAALDLSPYSTIIIVSDQPQSFYDNLQANMAKLEGFLNGGMQNVGLSPIFSYDYDNNRYMTYDGGAYRGLIITSRVGENAMASQAAIYIDPNGNGGYIFGDLVGTIYENADNMFELQGINWQQQVRTAGELGIAPANLYNSTSVGSMNEGTGSYFQGYFHNWQELTGKTGTGYTMALKNLDTHVGQNWGVYGISLYGTNTTPTEPPWTGTFGGQGSFGEYYNNGAWVADSGYWLMFVEDEVGGWTGEWNDNSIGGTARGRLVTRKKYGTSSGSIMGVYNAVNNTWEMASIGTWEAQDLGHWSSVDSPFRYYNGVTNTWAQDGSMSAVLGGEKGYWFSSSLILGRYTAGQANPLPAIWYADITSHNWNNGTSTTMMNREEGWGAHRGYAAGRRTHEYYTSGRIIAVNIIDEGNSTYGAGILYDYSLDGYAYRGTGMVQMYSGINRLEMDHDIGIAPQNLVNNIDYYNFVSNPLLDTFTLNDNPMGAGSGRPYDYSGQFASIRDIDWGIWYATIGGRYNNLAMSDNWYGFIEHVEPAAMFGQYMTGDAWHDNIINGSNTGYGANMATEATWITVGETLGTFNPDTTTFQMVSIGVGIDTPRYLEMVDTESGRSTLQALNVPCVQVGMVNLAQNVPDPNLSNVVMNNVRFFGTTQSSAPGIWATNDVQGNYSGNPLNRTAILSGGGLNAAFTVKGWNTADRSWMAGISGSGTLVGPSYSGNIEFRGAGAGTIQPTPGANAGSFAGTAAGAARAVVAR